MRLIDADELKKALGITSEDCSKCDWGSYESCGRGYDFEDACVAIDNAVTVDAVPMRHGRWETDGIMMDECEYLMTRCTACGGTYEYGFNMSFCPNCGARMDGKDDDHEQTKKSE